MESNPWQRVEELFEAALELSPGERVAFVERESRGDEGLRREVLSLLDYESPSLTHVEQAVAELQRVPDATGRRIGSYRITGLLGEGGMGAVYEAVRDDDVYEKRVALKIVRQAMDSPVSRARFANERQILATLEHKWIARLLDGGSDPVPFLVMEFIEGRPIHKYCEERGLSVTARVALFEKVVQAVAFAHQRLIIHRDLKPGNILITAEGEPRLLDFGIAKLIGEGHPDGLRTATNAQLMTPDYASPEQVRGEPAGTSSDVYSLGLILFELLTGERAQKMASYSTAEIYEVICNRELPQASTVAARHKRALRGDLDAIAATATHKDPARRYGSAEQLAADLRRYLEGRAVHAHADSAWYRTRKFVERYRWQTGAAVLLVASLAGGVVATELQAARAERRFREMRQISNQFLFEFHDEVAKLPGSIPARTMIVTRALQYLDTLARESGGDPELLTEAAIAYGRLARTQGLPTQANLGRMDDALVSYGKAVGILERLRSRGKASEAASEALVESEVRISQLSAHMGKVDESRKAAAKALEYSAEIRARGAEALEALGLAQVNAGDLAMMSGKAGEAVGHYRQGLEQRLKASGGTPTLNLSASYQRLGGALVATGDLVAALEAFRQSEAVDREILKKNPRDTRARRTHLLDEQNLGNVYGQTLEPSLGNAAEARVHYSRMLALAEEAHAADPMDVEARGDLIRAHFKMADVAETPAAALAHLAASEKVIESLPERPEKRLFLAGMQLYRAQRLRELRDWAGAKRALDDGERQVAGLGLNLAMNGTAESIRAGLSAERGEWHLAQGNRAAALPLFRRSMAMVWKGFAEGDLSATMEVSQSLDRMARASADEPAVAAGFRKRQADLWLNWKAKYPQSPFSARQLARALMVR